MMAIVSRGLDLTCAVADSLGHVDHRVGIFRIWHVVDIRRFGHYTLADTGCARSDQAKCRLSWHAVEHACLKSNQSLIVGRQYAASLKLALLGTINFDGTGCRILGADFAELAGTLDGQQIRVWCLRGWGYRNVRRGRRIRFF